MTPAHGAPSRRHAPPPAPQPRPASRRSSANSNRDGCNRKPPRAPEPLTVIRAAVGEHRAHGAGGIGVLPGPPTNFGVVTADAELLIRPAQRAAAAAAAGTLPDPSRHHRQRDEIAAAVRGNESGQCRSTCGAAETLAVSRVSPEQFKAMLGRKDARPRFDVASSRGSSGRYLANSLRGKSRACADVPATTASRRAPTPPSSLFHITRWRDISARPAHPALPPRLARNQLSASSQSAVQPPLLYWAGCPEGRFDPVVAKTFGHSTAHMDHGRSPGCRTSGRPPRQVSEGRARIPL